MWNVLRVTGAALVRVTVNWDTEGGGRRAEQPQGGQREEEERQRRERENEKNQEKLKKKKTVQPKPRKKTPQKTAHRHKTKQRDHPQKLKEINLCNGGEKKKEQKERNQKTATPKEKALFYANTKAHKLLL